MKAPGPDIGSGPYLGGQAEGKSRVTIARTMAREAGEPKRLTVAVTGPTGDIGRSFVRALERSPQVGRIVGMARRPFEPSELGWKRAEYRRGDVLERASLDELVEGADVVVHLAFIIFGGREETRSNNLEGSRNVFEAAVAAGARRLLYTSSVAAYGFHRDNPDMLTEDVRPRATDDFYYSAQKAELETLLEEVMAGSRTEAYVFRPCIVAGRDAPTLVEAIVDSLTLEGRLSALRSIGRALPLVKPVLPDPGVPFQLVHHDDVASALRAAVLGRGSPGVYNLAADDAIRTRDLADALGWHSLPVPRLAVDAAAEAVARAPLMPARASWVHVFRKPVLMDCTAARRELGWRPRHSSADTLRETVQSARAAKIV
jgi:UDP-glucose 4-epimerase